MGLFDGISDAWGDLWDSVSGNDAKRAQEEAMRNAQGYNQSALTAQQDAAQKELEFQRILAYFQMQQANQANQQGNTLAAQGLAGTLANQQNQANQFAQLYNQQQANNLPQQMAGLASLQALTPLMQMTGMQGYQMPTTLDTTKMVAPDIIGQFDTLSSKYASQYNNPATQQAQQQQSADFLKAMSDPAAWLASQGTAGTAAPGTALPTNIKGSIRPPAATAAGSQIQPTPPTQTAPVTSVPAGQFPTTPTETTALQLATGPAQGSRVEDSDIYRFNLAQAQRALNNQLAGRGLAGGGAQTKAQTDLALSMARDESQNQYNRLMALTQLGMGMQPSQQPANAASQLSSMYAQNAQNTNNALSNISQAQNQAAQNRSGMFTNLANAYGQNAANQSNALSNFYQANAGAAQQYGNWQAQQPSGLSRMIDLGTKIYGASQGFGGGSSPFGRFGASGTWSNPTSDYYLANTPAY